MPEQLALFVDRLPARPLATDDFAWGLYPLPKVAALQKKYIQPNSRTQTAWLTFDSDQPGAGHDWHLREAPTPNIVVENRANKHAHLLYGLQVPVYRSPAAHLGPLRYAAAVEEGLRARLGADPAYGGLICKNPLSDAWDVRTYEERLYDLPWLADYVDLPRYTDKRRHVSLYGLGRNCTMFENLRRWAYGAIRCHWRDFDDFRGACLLQAGEYNTFPAPLPVSELRSTSRSVAKWTWQTMSPEGFREYQRRAIKARWGDQVERRRQLLLDLLETSPDHSRHGLSRITGIPRSTIIRLLPRGGSNTISDNG
jgi:hypothetical protein